MKGTGEQITRATEIRANVINTLTTAMPIIVQCAPSSIAAKMAEKLLQARIDALNAPDVYAGDIIELFKDIPFTGDTGRDFDSIQTVYSTNMPQTAGQKALLG